MEIIIPDAEHTSYQAMSKKSESVPSSEPLSRLDRRRALIKNRDIPQVLSSDSATCNTREQIRTAIDLFAGIGGIRLGFEKAFSDGSDDSRLETIGVCEINEDSIRTYTKNFSDVDPSSICRDVHDFSIDDLGRHVDICLAGFPCQAFSMAGRRKGTEDERGRLFYEVLRICDTSDRPEVIFCENVKGLLSMSPPSVLDELTGYRLGGTFRDMLKALDDADYDAHYAVLNSRDFGVPQNRERLYIVAFDRRVYGHVEFHFPEGLNRGTTLESIWDDNPSIDLYLSLQYLHTLERHREHHRSLNHGFGFVVKTKDDVANALVCGGMGRERNLLMDPNDSLPDVNARGKPINKKVRMMSPLEWERLQGFTPGYTGAVCKTKRYAQLGNSVTVPVIEAVAREIRAVMDSRDRRRGSRRLRWPLGPRCIQYG